jgi:hypothetical protein
MRPEFLAGAATHTALILRSLQARQRRQASRRMATSTGQGLF